MRALATTRVVCSRLAAAAGATALLAAATLAQEMCGRPREEPQALFDRLTKSEGLKEDFRDKAYVAISDKAKGTVWTFTAPGHPAHPSVVCRRPVQDGAELRLQTEVQCNAVEDECQKLVKAFQELNQRMLREMRKHQGK